jgi:hypothetical protein
MAKRIPGFPGEGRNPQGQCGERLYLGGPALRDSPVPENQHPYLIGIDSKKLGTWHGHVLMSILFNRLSKPRLYFTAREQEVLRQALLDSTDMEISRTSAFPLGRSKNGGKEFMKRWKKLMRTSLGLFFQSFRSKGLKQRRRHLLNYVRNHPRGAVAFPETFPNSREKGNHQGLIHRLSNRCSAFLRFT